MNIINQLIKVYYAEENWHKKILSPKETEKYHKELLRKGRIIYVEEKGELLGYTESWRINFEQLGRLVCHASFSAYLENVTDGNIAYVANTWIKKEHRKGKIYKILRNRFFSLNKDCEYFVGKALRKKTQPIKVFTRSQIHIEKYIGG